MNMNYIGVNVLINNYVICVNVNDKITSMAEKSVIQDIENGFTIGTYSDNKGYHFGWKLVNTLTLNDSSYQFTESDKKEIDFYLRNFASFKTTSPYRGSFNSACLFPRYTNTNPNVVDDFYKRMRVEEIVTDIYTKFDPKTKKVLNYHISCKYYHKGYVIQELPQEITDLLGWQKIDGEVFFVDSIHFAHESSARSHCLFTVHGYTLKSDSKREYKYFGQNNSYQPYVLKIFRNLIKHNSNHHSAKVIEGCLVEFINGGKGVVIGLGREQYNTSNHFIKLLEDTKHCSKDDIIKEQRINFNIIKYPF